MPLTRIVHLGGGDDWGDLDIHSDAFKQASEMHVFVDCNPEEKSFFNNIVLGRETLLNLKRKALLPFLTNSRIRRLSSRNGRIFYLQRDASNTGLRSGSAHRVYLNDLFNLGDMADDEAREILREAVRVSSKSGEIYVGAYCTPEYFSLYRLRRLIENSKEPLFAGFKLQAIALGKRYARSGFQTVELSDEERATLNRHLPSVVSRLLHADPDHYLVRLVRRR